MSFFSVDRNLVFSLLMAEAPRSGHALLTGSERQTSASSSRRGHKCGVAKALDQEVDFLEEQIELLKLQSEKEGSLQDPVSEWENSDSEVSDQDDLN